MADLTSMHAMLTDLTPSVNTIKSDLSELKSNKVDITQVSATVVEESTRVQILSVIVIKQDARISHLEDTIKQMQRQGKHANLTISGLLETLDQTPQDRIKQVQSFFKDSMKIEREIQIANAYWKGQGLSRALLVQLQFLDDKSTIFEHVPNLKGIKNVQGKYYFVSDDRAEDEREQRNYYKSMLKDNNDLEEESKLKIYLKKGKLVVNNEAVKQKIDVPQTSRYIDTGRTRVRNVTSGKGA